MTNAQRAPIDGGRLSADLSGSRWRSIEVVAETGSTNKDLVAAAEPDRVLIAESQTDGRGRLGRHWETPAGTQIAVSVSVSVPPTRTADLGWVPLAAGLAVHDTVSEVSGGVATAQLKWPNDVLIQDRKLAGILAELALSTSPVAVVGVGLNVAFEESELPVPTATSLLLAAGVGDRQAVAPVLLRNLDRWLTAWEGDLPVVIEAYRRRCDTVGRRVRVELPGAAELLGTAVTVDEQGRVVVRDDAGVEHAVAAGDVTHLRTV
ncbi:biotin--[acetyl-CoA-carboxylase] ligase [Jongsikchunia kroppenstedtii]|uniref:biotin--[acetyl-CoA-carboxylase] ligase n=1 Tax=Jongsikchunia kroppenstedtii TaxID=1121721 RepID=UPI0003788B50|nr:biotin--[acetyl-CoA-carboxylase] ligase [Jongsikchunia kroppenstedtii]